MTKPKPFNIITFTYRWVGRNCRSPEIPHEGHLRRIAEAAYRKGFADGQEAPYGSKATVEHRALLSDL